MKRLTAAIAGAVAASWPALAAAQDGGRAVEAPSDAPVVVAITLAGVAAVMLLAALGYLYRRERGLDWEFQQPEEPHDDGDHAPGAAGGTAEGAH